jgi:tetratricopeptide (TPR) repeat protein
MILFVSSFLGLSGQAVVDLNKAIGIESSSFILYRMRGLMKYSAKDYQGSLADYTKLFAMQPRWSINWHDYFTCARSRFSLKDYQGAIADLNKEIEINPNSPKAYSMRALAKAEVEDLTGWCADLRIAVSLGYDYEFPTSCNY